MLRRRNRRERKERNPGKKLEEENWDYSYFSLQIASYY